MVLIPKVPLIIIKIPINIILKDRELSIWGECFRSFTALRVK